MITIITNIDKLRIKRMCYQFSKASMNNMKGVHPELVVIMQEAIKNSLIDFGVPSTGGVRTAAQQKALFDIYKSDCDGKVKLSMHQLKKDGYGHAVDFYAYVNGEASYDRVHLGMVASVIMSTAKRLKKAGKVSIELYWGGQFASSDFKGWDYPHIEIS